MSYKKAQKGNSMNPEIKLMNRRSTLPKRWKLKKKNKQIKILQVNNPIDKMKSE